MNGVMPFKNVISTQQFSNRSDLEDLFESAHLLKTLPAWQYPRPLSGKIVATLFYEPSTRTRLSFEAAVIRLGGQLLSTESASQFSSAIKGETLEDTIRVVSGYADIIILRHPEIGAAERAASVTNVPIINAGDGAGEHPTQALLDVFTIWELKGTIDGLHIGLVGDLKYGRTIHSLVTLLNLYDVTIACFVPETLQLPPALITRPVTFYDDWQDVAPQLDVIYMTRIQKERLPANEVSRATPGLVLDNDVIKHLKSDAVIMHPLPRLGEIPPTIDTDHRAAYFHQARNGLYVRMALLQHIIKGGSIE